jgi:hypothetical protein
MYADCGGQWGSAALETAELVNRRTPGHRAPVTLLQRFYLAMADVVLVVHAGFVAFVVFGLLLIWIGRFRHWTFVRNFWFRVAHLAAIGFVAAEALTGFVCPLTTWEDRLRLLAGGEERYAGSFIQHWVHRVIFYDLNERVFTVAYLAFLLAVALSVWLVPPQGPGAGVTHPSDTQTF